MDSQQKCLGTRHELNANTPLRVWCLLNKFYSRNVWLSAIGNGFMAGLRDDGYAESSLNQHDLEHLYDSIESKVIEYAMENSIPSITPYKGDK